MKINYNENFDILYLILSDNSNSYGDESDSGVVIHKDSDSDEITIITIFDFVKKLQENAGEIHTLYRGECDDYRVSG